MTGSRYWSLYSEDNVGDASIFLESLTKQEMMAYFGIFVLCYLLLSKYSLPIIYVAISLYTTVQLYLHQTYLMSWITSMKSKLS